MIGQQYEIFEHALSCTGISVDFSANPSWDKHEWDFGDGSGITGGQELHYVTHIYQDINTTSITARHRYDNNSSWCEVTIDFPGIFIGSGCGSTRLMSDLVNNNILPADELDGETIFIFGDLEIDELYTFKACTLKVMGGGKIIVKSGGKLTLSDNTIADAHHIVGSCSKLWNGFEVRTGGQLITNVATIKNAYYAIRPIYQVKGSIPLLSLTGTTFTENFIGLFANTAFGITEFNTNDFTGTNGTPTLGVSTCNPPEIVPGLAFNQRTYAGIYFDGSTGGILDLSKAAGGSYFEFLQAGIIVINGSANISRCLFINIAAQPGDNSPYQGTAITFIDNKGKRNKLDLTGFGKNSTNAIFNCDRGVFANASKGHTVVSIKDCRMEEVQNGIVLTESSTGNLIIVDIEDNHIECSNYLGGIAQQATSTGIEIHDPHAWRSIISIRNNYIEIDQPEAFGPSANYSIYPTGIHITALLPQVGASKNAMLLTIKENEIDLPAGYSAIRLDNVSKAMVNDNLIHIEQTILTSTIFSTGIGLEGGISNTASCNGITTGDICSGIVANSSVGLHLDANTTTDMYGIVVNNDNGTDCVIGSNTFKATGTSTWQLIGLAYNDALTGPQYLTANFREGDFIAGAGFDAASGQFSYCNSRYHVSPNANILGSSSNTVFVSQLDPCGPWFTVLNEPENTNSCPSTFAPAAQLNEADLNLASGGTESLNEGFSWSTAMGLYRKFTEYPELIGTNQVITDFMEGMDNEPLAAMYLVRNEFVSLFEDSQTDTTLNAIWEQMEIIHEDMDAISPTTSSIAWADWSAYSDQLDSLYALESSIIDIYYAQIESIATGVQTNNSAINCSNSQPCLNEKFIHELYLETQIIEPRALTPSELGQLQTIAQSCPGDAGPAVYQARSWYYMLTGETAQDSCTSSVPDIPLEERSSEADFVFQSLHLRPNPSSDYVQITTPALGGGDAILQIRDSWGRLVLEKRISPDEQQVHFSTAALTNGLYSVVLQQHALTQVQTAKFFVLH